MYLKFLALDISLNDLIIVYGDYKNLYYKTSIPLIRDRAGLMFTKLEQMINELKIDLALIINFLLIALIIKPYNT